MSRKILEGSYEIVFSSPEYLFTVKHGERLSTHTHAFGTYYVIKHFTGTTPSLPVRRRGSARPVIGAGHIRTRSYTYVLYSTRD